MDGVEALHWSRATTYASVLCGMIPLTSGCQSAFDYRASALPAQYFAPAIGSSPSIDLSKLAQAAVSTELVYPGDVLSVTIHAGLESTPPIPVSLRVGRDGTVLIPLVGPVTVAGMTLNDAERAIRRESIERAIYRYPHVSLTMQQRRSLRVQVVGAVEKPGVYELPAAGADVLAALVAAGGITESAGTVLEIRHPGASQVARQVHSDIALASYEPVPPTLPPRSVRMDLSDTDRPIEPEQSRLEDGSVVMVLPRVPQSVHVIGLVRRPNAYQLPFTQPLRLTDALAMAGDRTLQMADCVHIIRRVNDEDSVVIRASVKRAKRDDSENLVLAPGDVVSVEETSITFIAETMRGLFHFGFSTALPGI